MALLVNAANSNFSNDNTTQAVEDISSQYPSLFATDGPDIQEAYLTFLYRGQREDDARFILNTLETSGINSKEAGYIRQELEETLNPVKPTTILERFFG
jgi:hypothetical protein